MCSVMMTNVFSIYCIPVKELLVQVLKIHKTRFIIQDSVEFTGIAILILHSLPLLSIH